MKPDNYRPAVGDRCVFSPINRMGKKVKPYSGMFCKVVMTRYEPPPQWPTAPPECYVEFADGFRYWINPRHLYKA